MRDRPAGTAIHRGEGTHAHATIPARARARTDVADRSRLRWRRRRRQHHHHDGRGLQRGCAGHDRGGGRRGLDRRRGRGHRRARHGDHDRHRRGRHRRGGHGRGRRLAQKAAFIEQADTICADAEAEIDALGTPASAEELPDFLAKGVEIQTAQIEKLKGLEAPAEDADWWSDTLALLDQLNEATEKLRDKAAAGGTEAELNALADEATPINDELTQRAQEYGLQKCGT